MSARVTVLFRLGLGLVFLAAFLSLAVQLPGLVGSRGILPLAPLLDRDRAAGAGWGARLLDRPTLFWLDSSDAAIRGLPIAGACLSLLLVAGVGGRAVTAALLVLYLSGVTAGRDFFWYQWDNLLLETAFLAIFLPDRGTPLDLVRTRSARGPGVGGALPEPSPVVLFLLRWLLFRLLFESALAKIVYGADDWLSLRAMTYYYETAPLPSWGGWLVQQFPLWFHQVSVLYMFLVEAILPFALFVRHRAARRVFFLANGAFQTSIAFTSNYGFFNLLAFVLSLLALDDADLSAAGRLSARLRASLRRRPAGRAPSPERSSAAPGVEAPPVGGEPWRAAAARVGAWILLAAVVPASLVEGAAYFVRRPLFARDLEPIRSLYEPFRIVNVYHLFPGVVRERIVAEFEGTADGVAWSPIHLRYAPGDPAERPPTTWLHDPRLPFTFSFFTLGRGTRDAEYMRSLLGHLCCDPGSIRRFIEPNRFQERGPAALRVTYYRYRFGTWSDLERTGVYWLREPVRPPSRPLACSCGPAAGAPGPAPPGGGR